MRGSRQMLTCIERATNPLVTVSTFVISPRSIPTSPESATGTGFAKSPRNDVAAPTLLLFIPVVFTEMNCQELLCRQNERIRLRCKDRKGRLLSGQSVTHRTIATCGEIGPIQKTLLIRRREQLQPKAQGPIRKSQSSLQIFRFLLAMTCRRQADCSSRICSAP